MHAFLQSRHLQSRDDLRYFASIYRPCRSISLHCTLLLTYPAGNMTRTGPTSWYIGSVQTGSGKSTHLLYVRLRIMSGHKSGDHNMHLSRHCLVAHRLKLTFRTLLILGLIIHDFALKRGPTTFSKPMVRFVWLLYAALADGFLVQIEMIDFFPDRVCSIFTCTHRNLTIRHVHSLSLSSSVLQVFTAAIIILITRWSSPASPYSKERTK